MDYTVHGGANSGTRLSDFHFLTFHPLWSRPQVNFDPSVPPTSYSISQKIIGSGVLFRIYRLLPPSSSKWLPTSPSSHRIHSLHSAAQRDPLFHESDYDTQLLKPTPLQWPLSIKPCNDLQGPPWTASHLPACPSPTAPQPLWIPGRF